MSALRTRVTRARALAPRVPPAASAPARRCCCRCIARRARARGVAGSGFPKRIVTIAWANGVAQSMFYPPGDDPTASPILQPLVPLKSKVTLVVGVDLKLMVDGGHGADGHFLGAVNLFTATYKNASAASRARPRAPRSIR